MSKGQRFTLHFSKRGHSRYGLFFFLSFFWADDFLVGMTRAFLAEVIMEVLAPLCG
jgi:hypothetical protein